LSQQEEQLPITVHFFAHFKVSWILKWQYVFSTQNCIARQFSVNWWDKFKFSLVQSRLKNEFPERPLKVQDSVTHVSETQVEPATDFPKPESSTTSSKGKKPSKIKQVAIKLMQQIIEVEDGDEDEEASTAESSVQHHHNFDLFQDAQDPYDFTDLDLDS